MTVGLTHIQAATSILGRIAFSRGEDSDPVETLALWRASEGIDDSALEQAARESSADTMQEIEQVIADGGSFTTEQLGEYLVREYETAFQVGWIVRAREDARRQQDTETVRAAARDAG